MHSAVHCRPARHVLLLIGAAMALPLCAMAQQAAQPAGAAQPQQAAQQQFPPAGCTQDCDHWKPVKLIDFSPKHDVLIRNQDGTLQPMDEPYHKATLIAPGTWQILSDGDYQYLIEGDNEALAIDSGYGAGNIREFMQTLTKKPVRYVANTHDHFDHTADDSYFDRAFMSAYTRTKATIPFQSFAGLSFPRNYPITVVGDGYVFHLGNRDIEVFDIPNHTMGDLGFLDRKERIFFSGDVFIPVTINGESSVARFAANMRKLAAHRGEFDRYAGGSAIGDASIVDKLLANAEYILAGHEGDPVVSAQRGGPGGPGGPSDASGPGRPGGAGAPGGPGGAQSQQTPAPAGTIVYNRHLVRQGDGGAGGARGGEPNPNVRRMTYGGTTITYDIRHIQ